MADDWRISARRLTDALAGTEATPGGGSAAGIAAAMGCALGEMAAGISLRSKKLDGERRTALSAAVAELRSLRAEFQRLASEDAAAFDAVMVAYGLPQDAPRRDERIRDTLVKAGEVPLETARTAAAAIEKVRAARKYAIGTVVADMNCAEHLLRAAALAALENVAINVKSLKDPEAASVLASGAAEIRGRV